MAIYNVIPYLGKCLDSLREQTLKQIEVICIDDGSTDDSGKIADEYAKEDERFRVIHTNNRGLSASRNRGIDEARAEWLMFVDGDDWVDREFCRRPYEAAINNKADMVIFRSLRVHRNGKIENIRYDRYIGAVDELTANKSGGWATWNRIYNRRLFKNIRYPQGRFYEDYATTHKLVHEATKILIIDDRLYYYNADRVYSITHARRKTDARDGFLAAKGRYEDFVAYGYSMSSIKEALYAKAITFIAYTKPDDELYLSARGIVDSIKEIPPKFSFKQKAALLIWRFDDRLFSGLSRVVMILHGDYRWFR